MHIEETMSAGASVASYGYGGDEMIVNGPSAGGSSGSRPKHRKKPRSKSTSRSDEKPSRNKLLLGAASNSLSAIPNMIQLSMLSTGLLKISKYLIYYNTYCYIAY